jgi:sugar phosphate permease
MLAVGVLAQAAAAVTIHGPPFLIPTLNRDQGLSLVEASVLAVAPTFGVMLTLVAWGYVVDRTGERVVLLAGLAGTAVAGFVAMQVEGVVALGVVLVVAGGFAASTASASGRLVVGWFPAERRGLAMGIRQMAQPVGVGIAAISIAVLAERHGIDTALLVPALAALLATAAVALVVVDPPRPERTAERTPNPYNHDFLWRIHGVSILLVVPQLAVWTFGLVWLVHDRGWAPGPAGTLVAVSQVAGALGRIAVGQLSDMVGSRTRPLRWVAGGALASMALLGITAGLDWPVAVVLLVLATTVTVADNGLAFTAVAEHAGPFWSGRALGLQNTGQYLTGTVTAPVIGAAIVAWDYPWGFAVTALGPLLAIPLVPRDEHPPTSS